MNQRQHLVERIAQRIVWHNAANYERIAARSTAVSIVDDLYRASAEGKAVERALKTIEKNAP